VLVVAIGVEGRVEVDQVDGRIGPVAAQDVEVVAVVEDVGGEVRHRLNTFVRPSIMLGKRTHQMMANVTASTIETICNPIIDSPCPARAPRGEAAARS